MITIPLLATAVSGISFLSAFSVSTPSAFMSLVSFIRSITANTNANPSATGPALSTPIIPYMLLNIIIAGINITICLESDNIALFVLFPIA